MALIPDMKDERPGPTAARGCMAGEWITVAMVDR